MSDLILTELPRLAHKPSPAQLIERIQHRSAVPGRAAADLLAEEPAARRCSWSTPAPSPSCRPAGAASPALARARLDLHAPHLLDIELLSVLRRVVGAGDATADRAGEAVADLLDLPIERYGHHILAPRIWELRESFSAYDATYVALAESVVDDGASLLTTDARLARAAGAHTSVPVVLVA
jgi:predicted nucleic acid-binding protein